MSRGASSPVLMTPDLTPGVKRLLIVNITVYVVYLVLLRTPLAALVEALALTPKDVLQGGQIWQPVTYMFIHSPIAVGHLLGNLLMLYFMGTSIEQLLGTRRFYLLYLLSGMGGALLTLLLGGLAFLVPTLPLGNMWSSTHLGASGAVYGIVLCWGAMFWNQMANFFGVFELRVRHFIFILVGIQLLSLLTFAQDTSYSSHFGGMAVGYILGRYGMPSLSGLRTRAKGGSSSPRPARFQVIEGGNPSRKRSPQDDTAGRPIWLHRPKKEDDPTIH